MRLFSCARTCLSYALCPALGFQHLPYKLLSAAAAAERCYVAESGWWHVLYLREIGDTDELLVLREHCRKLHVLGLA